MQAPNSDTLNTRSPGPALALTMALGDRLPRASRGAALTDAATWNPRLDPQLRDAWLTYLVVHVDRWTHPTDVWACADEYQRDVLRDVAYETVQAARRLGYVIEGDRKLGYRYRRSTLPRYLHLVRRKGRRDE